MGGGAIGQVLKAARAIGGVFSQISSYFDCYFGCDPIRQSSCRSHVKGACGYCAKFTMSGGTIGQVLRPIGAIGQKLLFLMFFIINLLGQGSMFI
jgi:hypothetical protein